MFFDDNGNVEGLNLRFLGIQSKKLVYWVEWSILLINLSNSPHPTLLDPGRQSWVVPPLYFGY